MRLLKRRSQRLVACVFCNNGWRWVRTSGERNGAFYSYDAYVRCEVCGGSGDFVSRRDT